MKLGNAILVSDEITKTYVDFSSPESLKKTTGFHHPRLIRTQNTEAIGERLSFLVAIICDDDGKGGSDLAAKVAGRDSLPSDLILCAMDNKDNLFPLGPSLLDKTYNCLMTEMKPLYLAGLDAYRFFSSYGISPILDDLGVKPQTFFFGRFPNVICLVYRLDSDSPELVERFEDRLHQYANRILTETFEVDEEEGYRLSNDKSYYLWRDYPDTGLYYVFVQARKGDEDPCILGKAIKAFKEAMDDEAIDEGIVKRVEEFLLNRKKLPSIAKASEDAQEKVEEKSIEGEEGESE